MTVRARIFSLNKVAKPSRVIKEQMYIFRFASFIPTKRGIKKKFRIGMKLLSQADFKLGIGMIPRNQVSAEQVESYIDQERGKRRELLQKFLQSCSTSKVIINSINPMEPNSAEWHSRSDTAECTTKLQGENCM
ncbi:hypothetical protein AAZX31_07G249900 [Glycine max]|nr:hypothetical protein GLYMA_07G268750v4 [Glycine max]KAH1088842.1 hypothetical protein GYH30_019714 [Glycine max]